MTDNDDDDDEDDCRLRWLTHTRAPRLAHNRRCDGMLPCFQCMKRGLTCEYAERKPMLATEVRPRAFAFACVSSLSVGRPIDRSTKPADEAQPASCSEIPSLPPRPRPRPTDATGVHAPDLPARRPAPVRRGRQGPGAEAPPRGGIRAGAERAEPDRRADALPLASGRRRRQRGRAPQEAGTWWCVYGGPAARQQQNGSV